MKKSLLILALMALILPLAVLAQHGPADLPEHADLLDMIANIANYLFWILLAVSIVFIVYAGLLFVTASGNAEQVEKARGIILYAIIGIIVALLAYAIRGFLLGLVSP